MTKIHPSNLPTPIPSLLQSYNAPQHLQSHLCIVYTTATILLQQLKSKWEHLDIDETAILFGAASHDIGKAIVTEELHQSGNQHEIVGYQLLIQNNIPHRLARFAQTHGNWQEESLEVEDLLVTLADKIWKGKRIPTLEEKICHKMAAILEIDFWEIFVQLDEILIEIVLGADERF